MAYLGLAAPIQRWQAPKPGTRWRSGMCSRSYQSWNSSACAVEKSNAAISKPLAMALSFVVRQHNSPLTANRCDVAFAEFSHGETQSAGAENENSSPFSMLRAATLAI